MRGGVRPNLLASSLGACVQLVLPVQDEDGHDWNQYSRWKQSKAARTWPLFPLANSAPSFERLIPQHRGFRTFKEEPWKRPHTAFSKLFPANGGARVSIWRWIIFYFPIIDQEILGIPNRLFKIFGLRDNKFNNNKCTLLLMAQRNFLCEVGLCVLY